MNIGNMMDPKTNKATTRSKKKMPKIYKKTLGKGKVIIITTINSFQKQPPPPPLATP